MPRVDVVKSSPVGETFRMRQIEGMFDLPPGACQKLAIRAELPEMGEPWQIGLIVGPSGSGKSSVAAAAYGAMPEFRWPVNGTMIDGFESSDIREITASLVSVGLSSPPAWLRPFQVLSNGEQFRAQMARLLLAKLPVAVVDEFTSVVDRQVARVCSAAVSKAVRAAGVRLVAVSCHYDIAQWLDPDWMLDMADGRLERFYAAPPETLCAGNDPSARQTRGRLCRPEMRFEVRQAGRRLWAMFSRHHYLSHSLPAGCRCWAAASPRHRPKPAPSPNDSAGGWSSRPR